MPSTNNKIISMAQFRADREFVKNVEESLGEEIPAQIDAQFTQTLTPETAVVGLSGGLDDDLYVLRRTLIQFVHSLKTMLIGGVQDKMFRVSLPFVVELSIPTDMEVAGVRTSHWAIHLPLLFDAPNPLLTCTVRWLREDMPLGDYSAYGEPAAFQEVLNRAWEEVVTQDANSVEDGDRVLGNGLFLGAMRDAMMCLLALVTPMDMRAEPQDEFPLNPLGALYLKGDKLAVAAEATYEDGEHLVVDMVYNVNAVRRFLDLQSALPSRPLHPKA